MVGVQNIRICWLPGVGQMVWGRARGCIDCRSWRAAGTGSAEMPSLPRRVIGMIVCRTPGLRPARSLAGVRPHDFLLSDGGERVCPLRMRLFALMGVSGLPD